MVRKIDLFFHLYSSKEYKLVLVPDGEKYILQLLDGQSWVSFK